MEMRLKMPSTRKGLLLTLATIVLVVLMLAQIITYVSTQIDYGVISEGVSATAATMNFLAQLKSALPSFLHTSLGNAMSALVTYESTPTLRYDNFTNNTAYALASLMNNGTVYNTVMTGYMGNYVLKNFINSTVAQAQLQNVNVVITNVSIRVYQTSPFIVNATLTGLAVVNSIQGSVTYPISATGSASINGTWDLFYAEAADPHVIRAQSGLPAAVMIGNSPAISGSSSPFMLAAGAVVTENAIPTCANVPSAYQNGNYILVTQDAADMPTGMCGMAGLVTSIANSVNTPLVPYLIYPATSGAAPTANVFGLLQNGTRILLDGPALSILNTSPVQGAVQNGYYYASGLTPSYLGYGQGALGQRSGAGMFSLNLYSRAVKDFSGVNSYVAVANSLSVNSVSFTVSAWVYPTSLTNSNGPRKTIVSAGEAQASGFVMAIDTNGNMEGDFWVNIGGSWHGPLTAPNNFWALNKWYLITATYNNAYMSIYVNGQLVNTTALSGQVSKPAGATYIGSRNDGVNHFFPGKIANVQLYNESLSQQQVMQLYLGGMESHPLSNAYLLAWWPLAGNYSDMSGHTYTGVPSNVVGTQLTNYPGDPLTGGSFYTNMTSKVLGAGSPGCTSLTNCGANTVLSQLFLSSSSATGNYSGRAAKFTYGSGLSASSPVNTPTGSAVTGVFWIKPYSAEASGCNLWPINYGPDSGTGASFLLGVAQSTLRPALATWANDYYPASGPTLNLRSWNFLAGTVSGSTATIYLNGQSESATLGATPNIQHGQLSSSFAGKCSNSSVADVQLYNSVLTAQQLQALYAEGINGAPIQVNTLTDWFPLNGNSTDMVNGRNNMTNTYVAYTTQYTNQSAGTYSGLAALRLADAGIPNAASFGPGGNGYGYAQTNPSLAFNPSTFSVSFWMYPRTDTGNNPPGEGSLTMLLANMNPGRSGWNWDIEYGNGGTLYVQCGDCASTGSATASTVNKWYFVTAVYSGSSQYLYVNGSLASTCSGCGSVGNSASPLMFGSDACNSCNGGEDWGGYFNGYLADARLYSDTALTAAQVQQLYQNDSVAGLPANDVWPLSGAGFSQASAMNTVVDTANSLNSGLMYSNTLVCTVANTVAGQCGIYFTQP